MPVFDSINNSDLFIYFCIKNKRNRQFQYNTPAIISNKLIKFYTPFRDIVLSIFEIKYLPNTDKHSKRICALSTSEN